jgi:hypothetical protein
MTMTSTSVHVRCESYCGAALFNPGMSDHDDKCGAPPDEIVRLNEMLAAARIKAAAEEAAQPDLFEAEKPSPYRCSCGEEFDDWGPLGTHQSLANHTGMYDESRTFEGDVDGEPSRIVVSPRRTEQRPRPEWEDPEIATEWVFALQERLDHAEMNVGGVPAGKKCPGKAMVDGVELDCPHRIFAKAVETAECDLNHRHTTVLEAMCLIHSIVAWGGGIPPAGNGPLFERA